MTRVYINGQFFEEKEAVISVFDHGFLYGDGIYETLRAYSGSIFRVRDHLDRLFHSAEGIHLTIPWNRKVLSCILAESLEVNQCKDAMIRLSISRGTGPLGLDPDLCPKPTITVITRPFEGYPETLYRDGIRLSLVTVRKTHPKALDPGIKSTNFLNNILAKIQAKEAGADEAILVNQEGFLTEGTVSNLFFVRGKLLSTPSAASGILEGVSRKVVLEIAQSEGIPFEEGSFTAEDLKSAEEVFVTNTSYEVMPVRELDKTSYQIGSLTRRLGEAFRERVQQELRA